MQPYWMYFQIQIQIQKMFIAIMYTSQVQMCG